MLVGLHREGAGRGARLLHVPHQRIQPLLVRQVSAQIGWMVERRTLAHAWVSHRIGRTDAHAWIDHGNRGKREGRDAAVLPVPREEQRRAWWSCTGCTGCMGCTGCEGCEQRARRRTPTGLEFHSVGDQTRQQRADCPHYVPATDACEARSSRSKCKRGWRRRSTQSLSSLNTCGCGFPTNIKVS